MTPGDSLSGIADDQHLQGGWQRLYAANRAVVGDDPDLIFPGQRLTLTGTPRTATKAEPKTASKAVPKATPKTAPKPVQTPKPQQKQQTKPQPKKTQPQRTETRKTQTHKTEHAQKHSGLTAPVVARTGTPYHQAGSWSSGYHTGVDFPVPTGTSVKAMAAGTVVSAGWAGPYGYQVVIRHGDGKYSQYAHLSSLLVRGGQHVGGGQRIARSGATGNVTGPHLHFEVRTGPEYGSDIDPLAYLRAGGVKV